MTDFINENLNEDKNTDKKIGYMYRENPTSEFDTGWRFFAGDEDEQYTNNSDNLSIFDLNTICNYDKTIIPYLKSEIGSSFEKTNGEFKKGGVNNE